MKSRKIENGLALIGAVLVLVGVTAAATSALANTGGPDLKKATVAELAGSAPLAKAATANREAAEHAAKSIARDSKLDLEIRLLDRSYTIAARSL